MNRQSGSVIARVCDSAAGSRVRAVLDDPDQNVRADGAERAAHALIRADDVDAALREPPAKPDQRADERGRDRADAAHVDDDARPGERRERSLQFRQGQNVHVTGQRYGIVYRGAIARPVVHLDTLHAPSMRPIAANVMGPGWDAPWNEFSAFSENRRSNGTARFGTVSA